MVSWYTILRIIDALYKIDYYLAHEEERAKIACNAREKMWSEFTYEKQIGRMLEVVREEA